MKTKPASLICALTALFIVQPQSQGAVVWTQLGGTSGTSGAGNTHINSLLSNTSGSDGSVNLHAAGTVLSYGTVADGTFTLDYSVTFDEATDFGAGENRLMNESINNAFVIHSTNSADYYTSLFGSYGRNNFGSGTFADNGGSSITIRFFQQGSYSLGSNSGVEMRAQLGLVAINHNPNTIGGTNIANLSTDEFYDIGLDSRAGGSFIESDTSDQIIIDTTPGATTLANYTTGNSRPIGSTGATDPGTGGITDPLNSDFRLEFNKSHQVSAADWSLTLPSTHSATVNRTGDPGIRSGIGFLGVGIDQTLGDVGAVPEPSRVFLLLVAFSTALLRRHRSSPSGYPK